MVWRPFGIPLLASVSGDENIRGDDLQRIVRQMLDSIQHPDDIHQPSIYLKSNMGAASKANQDTIASEAIVSAESVCQDRELDTSTLVEEARQHLQLFDAKGECIEIASGEDTIIRLSSPSMLMFINWSEKDLKKYNTHYLENLPEVYKSPSASKRARIEPLSLYACLDAFLREEPLVPEDMWYCPRCKERRQASKKLDLWRLPEVLVIHLKRFSFSRSSKSKLETFVNFPIHDFDLTNYVARKGSPQRQLYELYALSNHYGGMGSGHYTSYIKLLDENKWYNFDDNHIYPLAEDDVKSNAAYVLFYRRVKVDE